MPHLENNNTDTSNSAENDNAYKAAKNDQRKQGDENSKKAVGVAGKAALNYFTGGQGGKIYDAAKKAPGVGKVLNKAEGKVGKLANRATGGAFGKIAKKANDMGVLDAANKAMSLNAANKNGASKDSTGKGSNNDSTNAPGESNGNNKSKSPINSTNDSDDSEEKESELSGFAEGFGFLKDPKFKLIIIGAASGLIILLGLLVLVVGENEQSQDTQDETENACGVTGSCLYTIKGFTNKAKTFKTNMDISNLKVRLMKCDGSAPMPNEPLVDFEKYILGTTYQEHVGKEADTKAQAIAARSYALARPSFMGNAGGTKLAKENGQWILQLRDCTNDQAYCDPDRGYPSTACSSAHGKLEQNSKIRQWVAETEGQVLVDSNGYIINTNYVQSDQTKWHSLANEGLDYNQILLQHYRKAGAAKIVSMNCTGSGNNNCNQSTGDYANWLQGGQSWSGIHLGTSSHTIGQSGCLATSIAMLIAKAGVSTNVNGEFNPGTFVEALNSINGFDGANLLWSKVTEVAPSFVFGENIIVHNYSREQKLSKIKELLDNGYAVVAEVKGNTGQHWVAIDNVTRDEVIMMDPASTSTIMWEQYGWKNTSRLVYYKINK